MDFFYNTFRRSLMLKVTVKTGSPEKIRLIVVDPDRSSTVYMDRYKTIKGIEDFIIRLPQTADRIGIRIINLRTNNNDGFELKTYPNNLPFDVLPLDTKMSTFDFRNPLIASFILFAQEFSDKAGYLSPGEYLSPDNFYTIDYLDAIKSVKSGEVLNTPARISVESNIIQVSKRSFKNFTIPGRFAILLHEFCHVFANKRPEDEIEADYHAATIYCALGYPRIEIINVFGNVFINADNELNRARFQKIKDFIMNFDHNSLLSIKYN